MRLIDRGENLLKTLLAKELGEIIRPNVSAIFTDGFYQWLRFFSKDKNRLARAFAHIFNFNVFWVTVDEQNNVLGIAACSDCMIPSVQLCKKEFRKHLGLLRGSIAFSVLKKEFEEKQYPFPISEDMGMVEFVATASEHRGKGVAETTLRHIFSTTPFTQYALEVADTNIKAVRLYEKLGFSEFMRVVEKHSDKSGVNALVYMKAIPNTHNQIQDT
jgi:ribosomal protein S18 acetylase RimI-like enzyme